MRNFLDAIKSLLNEADNLPAPRHKTDIEGLPGERADRNQTARAVRDANIRFPHRAAEHYRDAMMSGIRDNISDVEALQNTGGLTYDSAGIDDAETPALEDHTIENLPAIVSTEVGPAARLEWHQIKNMPGYVASQIRGIGRQIFGHLTDTPLEDIQTVNTAMNKPEHVQALMGWLVKNGEMVDDFDMDLGRIMPGYRVKAKLYNALGYQFFCMQDDFAEYVYAWPRTDNALKYDDKMRLEGIDPEIVAEYNAFMEGDDAGDDSGEEEIDESAIEEIVSREKALERAKQRRREKGFTYQAQKKDEPKSK